MEIPSNSVVLVLVEYGVLGQDVSDHHKLNMLNDKPEIVIGDADSHIFKAIDPNLQPIIIDPDSLRNISNIFLMDLLKGTAKMSQDVIPPEQKHNDQPKQKNYIITNGRKYIYQIKYIHSEFSKEVINMMVQSNTKHHGYAYIYNKNKFNKLKFSGNVSFIDKYDDSKEYAVLRGASFHEPVANIINKDGIIMDGILNTKTFVVWRKAKRPLKRIDGDKITISGAERSLADKSLIVVISPQYPFEFVVVRQSSNTATVARERFANTYYGT